VVYAIAKWNGNDLKTKMYQKWYIGRSSVKSDLTSDYRAVSDSVHAPNDEDRIYIQSTITKMMITERENGMIAQNYTLSRDV